MTKAELVPLLRDAHHLARRALRSTAEIRDDDVEVLAEAYAGVGSALDVVLPLLRTASRFEQLLQRRGKREDRAARVP